MTTDLGERFATAIAAQDAAALMALLAPDVSFRALTPGKFWEADDASVVVEDVIGVPHDGERQDLLASDPVLGIRPRRVAIDSVDPWSDCRRVP